MLHSKPQIPSSERGEPIPPGYVDVLRLSEPERRLVLEEFTGKGVGAEKRRAARVSCGLRVRALIDVTQFQGGQGHFVVYTVDISNSGIGFLHGGYLHQNTACVVKLRSEDGSPFAIEGKIVRCQLVRGRVHEVGVEFSAAIDLENLFPSLAGGQKSDGGKAGGAVGAGGTGGTGVAGAVAGEEPLDPARKVLADRLLGLIGEVRGKAELGAIAEKLSAIAAEMTAQKTAPESADGHDAPSQKAA